MAVGDDGDEDCPTIALPSSASSRRAVSATRSSAASPVADSPPGPVGCSHFIARSSGGAVIPSADQDSLSARLRLLERPVEVRRTRPLHSAWWMLPFCGLLGLEWTLRRRRGQR